MKISKFIIPDLANNDTLAIKHANQEFVPIREHLDEIVTVTQEAPILENSTKIDTPAIQQEAYDRGYAKAILEKNDEIEKIKADHELEKEKIILQFNEIIARSNSMIVEMELKLQKNACQLALVIGRKLAEHAMAKFPDIELKSLLDKLLKEVRVESKMSVIVPITMEKIVADLEEKYKERFSFQVADNDEYKIFWDSGNLIANMNNTYEEIVSKLEKML